MDNAPKLDRLSIPIANFVSTQVDEGYAGYLRLHRSHQAQAGLDDQAPVRAGLGDACGRVRAGREKAGTPMRPLDTQIGARALSWGAVLVASIVREFRRIPGLKVENRIG